MTKKYTSKQEYVAFYWDGSNVEALQDWLNDLGVAEYIEIESCGCQPTRHWFLTNADGRQAILTPYPEYVVVFTTFDGTLNVHDVDTFNKFFVEVAE